MVNVFGGGGFVGSAYVNKFNNCIVNERNDYEIKSNNILYFISTVDNYNVFDNPYIDIETNLTLLIRILEQLKEKDDAVFNFISSWFVYGDTDLPATEESYCDPKGFYSITKRTAEQLLISYCKTFNINYRILRLANVIGTSDSKASKKKNALIYLIDQLKQNKDINLYENGDLFRDYIFIEDCLRAINLVIKNGDTDSIYNIGNGDPIKLYEIIMYAKNKLKSTSKITGIDTPDFHKIIQVKSMYMNNDKLTSLGYSKKYNVYDMVDKLL